MRENSPSIRFSATISPLGRKITSVAQAPEKKLLSQAATKLDLQQLKTKFMREFTARTCLILARATALLFGLLKVF